MQQTISNAQAYRAAPSWRTNVSERRTVIVALAFALIWPTYLTAGLGPLNVTPARLFSLFAFIVVVYRTIVDRQRGSQLVSILGRSPAMFGFFVLYTLWRLYCDTLGWDRAGSYVLTTLDIISGSFFLLTLTSISSFSVQKIMLVIFWANAILILIGLGELAAHKSVAPFLSRFSSMSAEKLVVYGSDVYRGDIFRVRSLSSHPILFGSFVAACVPVVLHVRQTSKTKFTQIAAVAMLALTPVIILSTNARSAIIGGVAGLICFQFIRFVQVGTKSARWLTVYVLAALLSAPVVIIGAASSNVLDHVAELVQGRDRAERGSSANRLIMVRRGLTMLERRPFVGYGDGLANRVAGLVGHNGVLTIDSYYLAQALNFGYVGFALNLLFLLSALVNGFQASLNKSIPFIERSGIAALFGASVCIVICAITVTSSEYFVIIYALAASAAATMARGRLARRALKRRNKLASHQALLS